MSIDISGSRHPEGSSRSIAGALAPHADFDDRRSRFIRA
jgi:hypothetical protein